VIPRLGVITLPSGSLLTCATPENSAVDAGGNEVAGVACPVVADYGEIERTRDGATYRIGYPARPAAFDLAIDDLDLRATAAAYR
jgi:hypothetical protein